MLGEKFEVTESDAEAEAMYYTRLSAKKSRMLAEAARLGKEYLLTLADFEIAFIIHLKYGANMT